MTNNCLKPQEAPFSRGNLTIFYKEMATAQQTRHLWVASDITPNSESLGSGGLMKTARRNVNCRFCFYQTRGFLSLLS